MPSDYNSTARALALPTSPQQSPSLEPQRGSPAWSLRQSSTPQSGRQSPFSRGGGLRDKFIDNAERIQRRVSRTIKRLTPVQRFLACIALIVNVVLVVLFLVYNERIFGWLEPYAARWKDLRGGWLIIWAFTFIAAFPPLIGYSTCVTTAGFVYGFPVGWFIIASATVIGSLCSFIVSRTILSKFVHRLIAKDRRFAALSLTLKHDGLKLLCMIRLCPLPYSISNGALSTFPTVHPLMFALATAIVSPKLLIHVFIGSRLAAIARSGEKMDAATKAINYASIVIGAIVGIATGWFIYRRTIARAEQVEEEERSGLRQSVTRGEGYGEFSDDPEDEAAAATVLRDDDVDFFDDTDNGDAGGYRDDSSGTEQDVFRHGDGDEENSIGLNRQQNMRET